MELAHLFWVEGGAGGVGKRARQRERARNKDGKKDRQKEGEERESTQVCTVEDLRR